MHLGVSTVVFLLSLRGCVAWGLSLRHCCIRVVCRDAIARLKHGLSGSEKMDSYTFTLVNTAMYALCMLSNRDGDRGVKRCPV